MIFGFTNLKVRAVDEIRIAFPGTPAKGRPARTGANRAALRLGLRARAVSRRAAAQDCIGHAPGRCTAQERVSSAGGPVGRTTSARVPVFALQTDPAASSRRRLTTAERRRGRRGRERIPGRTSTRFQSDWPGAAEPTIGR